MEMVEISAIQKQYRRLWLADEDLDEVCAIVELLADRDLLSRPNSARDLELKVLSTAIIVAYARAFVKSRSSSNDLATPALPEGVLDCFTPEQLRLHNSLLDRRGAEFAHSDIGPTELELVIGTDGEIAQYTGTRVPLNRSEIRLLQPMLLALRAEITRRLAELRTMLSPGSTF